MGVREDGNQIIEAALTSALPDVAIKEALAGINFNQGRLIVVSIGKAGWQMAKAASVVLGEKIDEGFVVTKYGHVQGEIQRFTCFEAGHPVPDQNSFNATKMCMEAVSSLKEDDNVLFLISGGGSALFESPIISGAHLADITEQLLKSGADIVEINTIRKRLSQVKGGRFAQLCNPGHVFSIILSDVIGNPLDMIASGPAHVDTSTSEDALRIIDKYGIVLPAEIKSMLLQETPKELHNVSTFIAGDVEKLCTSAKDKAKELGYKTLILTKSLACQAKEAGLFLGAIAKDHQKEKIAFICGGETVVKVTGNGLGGRNQELALMAALEISGLKNTVIFSVGSDGTDGPTDAAGGFVDGTTYARLKEAGINVFKVLEDNDSYNALKAVDSLIVTGPTGTNVNDLTVVLIDN